MAAIGMIGIGLMGHGIASNVLRHGHALTLLQHPGNQPLEALLAAGARAVPHVAAVAEGAEVVILCVTGTPEVQAVMDGGLLAALRPGQVVVDCSTALPDATVALAARVRAAGARFVDAPMTRTPAEAAAGRLNLIVGGEPADVAAVEPLLRCFAENIVHAGPVGAGHRMKLVHNFVSLGFSVVLAEAAACAAKAGIEPAVLLQVLGQGGGAGVVFNRMKPFIESGDGSGFRFTLANAAKDLGYYAGMAEALGAEAGAARALRDVVQGALADGPPGATMPELVTLLSRRG